MCCVNRYLPDVITDLKSGRPKTVELQSTHNIVTIVGVEPGPDIHIFMTSVDIEDLSAGDPGICVFLLATNIAMKRIVRVLPRPVL